MPDSFKDSLNLPIAIPAWGLVLLLFGGVFTAGVTFQKLDQVIETTKKIDIIQERQINGLATLKTHDAQLQNHDARITILEQSLRHK
jgi:hypothetical protein